MKKYDKKNIRQTFKIAWPAVLESFFVAFASLIDSLMVSSVGSDAVAAIGVATQPKLTGLVLFTSLNVALSALIARRKGEGKKEDANQIFVTYMLFLVIVGGIISAVLFFFANQVIHFCGSEENTHILAVSYFRIIEAGMIFNCVQLGINAAQRGAGNTKITMRTNAVSSIINIVFNYLLIGGKFGFPALGIRGAAYATVLGIVVSCIMSILSVQKESIFVSISYVIKRKIIPSMHAMTSIIHVGYGIFLEQLLMRIGFLSVNIMVARLGTDSMAAHQVGMNIMSLSFSFGDGLQAAAVALIGYSLGMEKPELAKEYGRICRMFGGIISILLSITYYFIAEWIMRLFFHEEKIVAIGVQIMWMLIFIVVVQISQVVYMGSLRGAGDTLYTAVVSTISVTIIRTVGSYIGCYVLHWGIIGIWTGIFIDQSIRLIFASIRFHRGKWVNIRI